MAASGVLVSTFAAAAAAATAGRIGVGRSALRHVVFTEDTDCFGVLYHANYVKLVCRAGERHLASSGLDASHHLTHVARLDYLKPARLGDELEVRTSASETPDEDGLVLEHEFMRGSEQIARAQASFSPEAPALSSMEPTDGHEPQGVSNTSHESTMPFDVWWEDIDARTGGLSATAVVRAMERHRSSMIGGPTELARALDGGVGCAIARTDQLRFFRPLAAMRAGEPGLQLRSSAHGKGSRIVFDQALWHSGLGGEPVLMARALMTVVCFNADTGRVVRPPAWLQQTLEL